MKVKAIAVALGLVAALSASVSHANIFVGDIYERTIGVYADDGAPINPSLITDAGGFFAMTDSRIYVINGGAATGTVSEYSTSGQLINPALITGLQNPSAIAVSGSSIFISEYNLGRIGEYTTAGTTVNPALITGLYEPQGLAIAGSSLYVANGAFTSAWVGQYLLSGAVVNGQLVTGLNGAYGLAVSDDRLYVAQRYGGSIGVYDATTGATINSALVTGLNQVIGVAVSGGYIYVADPFDAGGTGQVGQYTLAGLPVNPSLIQEFRGPVAVAIAPVPEPVEIAMWLAGIPVIGYAMARRRRADARRRG